MFSSSYNSLTFDRLPMSSWNSVHIKEWLASLELVQYFEQFEENSVSGKELRELDEADLFRIGVKPLGHRKKIYRSILELANKRKHSGMASAAHVSHSSISLHATPMQRLDRRVSCNPSS